MALIKYFGQRFGYEGVKFHREGPKVAKTCPGTSLDKATMIKEAKEQNKDVGGKIMALTRGDKGSEVTKLQQNLIALGYGKLMDPYGADGSFGPATESAVKAFQSDYKLEIDGIAGSKTQAKISELLKKSAKSEIDYKKMYEEAQKKLDDIKKIL